MDAKRYRQWIAVKANRDKAKKWLKKNPPPKEWRGTRLQWAYLEMPSFPWG